MPCEQTTPPNLQQQQVGKKGGELWLLILGELEGRCSRWVLAMWEVNLLIESCYLHPLLYIPDLVYSFVMKAYQTFGEPQLISATPVPSPQESQHSHQALQCWTLHHSWLPPAPWRQQTHDLTRLPFLPALHSHQDCHHDKQAKHKLKGLSNKLQKKVTAGEVI
jgi:hypothetical protein